MKLYDIFINIRVLLLLLSCFLLFELTNEVASAAPVEKYNMQEGTTVDCSGNIIHINSLTQFANGYKGISVSQSEKIIDVDLSILNTWWNPTNRQEYRSIHEFKDEFADYSDDDYEILIKDSRVNRNFRLHSMCQLQYSGSEFALIRYFLIDKEKQILDTRILVMRHIDEHWKISLTPIEIFPLEFLFSKLDTAAFAYLISEDPLFIERKVMNDFERNKLISIRPYMLNEDNELMINKLVDYTKKIIDGYHDQELDGVINIKPLDYRNRMKHSKPLSETIIQRIQVDLVGEDPAVVKMIINRFQSHGQDDVFRLLNEYIEISSGEALDLVESWVTGTDILE